jgi:hypothetical protein
LQPGYCETLSDVLLHNPNLHTLSTPVNTAVLHCIVAHAPQLQYFGVRAKGVPQQSRLDCGILAVACSCTQLRRLYFSYCIVTDEILVALGTHCPRLTAFAAGFGVKVTDVGVCALAQGCRQLRELAALQSGYFRAPVSVVGITALATHCPHLRELEVHRSVVASSANSTGTATMVVGKIQVTVHDYFA